ncbi:MAG: hypothetical protein IPO76_10180 [Elusimicrobia bacterium]|nr:hypothetical protein [Elusimicrobiota bacterium]MBK7575422.1 hypothetical protein [Elusimicrobiota bacterium]MBK7689132.1 hypothetical protein [Elusimicrobiota bacterium]MBK9695739.1 hypothetical protein [Elusimicrobiota bacterium]MBK9922227.1 hypothetical protein [Elusimicrobiota bacterium]
MKRELNKILDDLIIELEKMVTMLRRDTSASWTRGFEGFLAEALDLKKAGYPGDGVRGLCGSVRSVYGGMGSFNDYFPQGGVSGEEFERVSTRIYELANEIRVISSY